MSFNVVSHMIGQITGRTNELATAASFRSAAVTAERGAVAAASEAAEHAETVTIQKAAFEELAGVIASNASATNRVFLYNPDTADGSWPEPPVPGPDGFGNVFAFIDNIGLTFWDGEAFASISQATPIQIGALVQGLPENFDAARMQAASEIYTDLGSGDVRLRIGKPANTVSAIDRLMCFGRFHIGAAANAVTFEHDFSDTASGYPVGPNNGLVWRELGEGPSDWKLLANKATNGSVQSGQYIATSRTEAHTIEVASQPVFQYDDLVRYVSELSTRDHVHEAPSALAALNLPVFVHKRQTVPAPATRTETTNTYDPKTVDQYAIRITNTASTPAGGKLSVVLLCMQHAAEHQGEFAWRNAIDWLTLVNTDPAQEDLRLRLLNAYEFLVYNVNPAGRATGHERSTEEATTDVDSNRQWIEPSMEAELGGTNESVQVRAVMEAILVDTVNMASSYALVDFHGAASLADDDWSKAQAFYGPAAGQTSPATVSFMSAFRAKGFSQAVRTPDTKTNAQSWFRYKTALTQDGRDVIAVTYEFSRGGPGYPNVAYGTPNKALFEVFRDLASAAPTVVPASSATLVAMEAPTSTILTSAYTVQPGVNRALIVSVAYERADPVRDYPTLTYAGQPMTRVAGRKHLSDGTAGFREDVALYVLLNPPVGAANVVATFTPASGLTYDVVIQAIQAVGVGSIGATFNAEVLRGTAGNPASIVTTTVPDTQTIFLHAGDGVGPNFFLGRTGKLIHQNAMSIPGSPATGSGLTAALGSVMFATPGTYAENDANRNPSTNTLNAAQMWLAVNLHPIAG